MPPPYMYCPNCKKENLAWVDKVSPEPSDNKKNGDIYYYKRKRMCEECRKSFYTAELEEKYVTELINLRERAQCLENLVAKLKKAMDAFVSVAKNTLTNTVKITELQAKKEYVAERLFIDYKLNVQDVHSYEESSRYRFYMGERPLTTEVLSRLAELSSVRQEFREEAKLIFEYRRLDKEIKELLMLELTKIGENAEEDNNQ